VWETVARGGGGCPLPGIEMRLARPAPALSPVGIAVRPVRSQSAIGSSRRTGCKRNQRFDLGISNPLNTVIIAKPAGGVVRDEEATSKGGGHPLRAHASRLVRLSAGSLSAKIARKVPVRSASAVASATVVAYQRRQRADLLVSIIANAVNRNKRPVGLVRIE
jgi:hypothetical protein